MKTIATLPLLLLLFVANGHTQDANTKSSVASENRTVKEFHGIKVGGAFEVSISQGSQASLTIEADKEALPNITTKV